MNLLLVVVISVAVSAGVILLLSRDVFRIVMGLAILAVAANLVIFIGGRPDGVVPAVIQYGGSILPVEAASPLPQALVLTAIVIGFALLVFALVLAAAVTQHHGHADVSAYSESEPRNAKNDKSGKPPVMEAE
jgi:multicomponent Na+:H+ antiporter subunit C